MGFMDVAAGAANPAGYGLYKMLSGGNKGMMGLQSAPMDDSYLSPLKDAIASYKDIPTLTPDKMQAYQAKNLNDIPEYQQMSQRTNQNFNQQQQQSSEALQRRFAGMGGLNSGAYIKQAGLLDQQNNEQRNQALNDVGMQFSNQERNRAYESGEKANAYNTQSGNQFKQANAENQYKNQAFRFEGASKIASMQQAQRQFEQQQREAQFNAGMNMYQQQHSGGLLGAGGALGTGISL